MSDIPGPYVQFTLVTAASNTSTSIERSTVGPDGPWVMVQPVVQLLNGRAFFVDTTAPVLNSGVTTLWYRFVVVPSGLTQVLSVIPANPLNAAWLTDPVRPWADIALDVCDTTVGHAASCTTPDPEFVWGGFTGTLDLVPDAELVPILNAEHPADIFARRKYAEGEIVFFTRTLDAIDRVYDLFTAGGPLMLRLDAVYGFHDQFIQPGTLAMSHTSRDQRRPERRWVVPFVVVDRPFGPIQGTDCNNWCAVEESFTTFADLTAYPSTWEGLLNGDVLCPDTPPELDGFGMGGFGDGPFGDGG